MQENNDDEDHHILIYNEPKLATATVSDDKEWKSTIIVPAFDNDGVYTIH